MLAFAQHKPRSITVEPPSEVTSPPHSALFVEIVEIAFVETVGLVAFPPPFAVVKCLSSP